MPDDTMKLEDKILLALYQEFQRERRALGEIYPQPRYYDFIDRGRYLGSALPAPMVAQNQISDLANKINRFCYDLHGVRAWSHLFGRISEGERTQALYEFVFLLASHVLAAPYSIKQMLVTSIYQISYHTNRFCKADWAEGSFHKKANFQDAEKAAVSFISWPAVSHALSKLNDDTFIRISDDFRNRFHHGFAPGIEFGFQLAVRQVSPGSTSYVVRHESPLLLSDLIPILDEQYCAAIAAYDSYIELIKEQERIWPKP